MEASFPRLEPGARAAPAAAVALLHIALIAGLVLISPVRERLLKSVPLIVSIVDTPREQPPEVQPPKPQLRAAPQVQVALPPIAIQPEVAIPPPEPRPTITGPVTPPPAVQAAEVTQAIEPPRFNMAYLKNPPPSYPNASRRAREQGRVLLGVLVNTTGEPETVEVRDSSGSPRLDQAAIEAVKRWRFEPARRGGKPIAGWALVPILFQLET